MDFAETQGSPRSSPGLRVPLLPFYAKAILPGAGVQTLKSWDEERQESDKAASQPGIAAATPRGLMV